MSAAVARSDALVSHTEPPTHGKVVLVTDRGDIDVELWPKEAPLAVRNFVQLCMEGYYDNCVFHRVVKDFLVQTGDPTGTGSGGESAYNGKPFKDEFNMRLKFSHRGLVAMANSGPNTNQSQFFITLDKVDWLNKKNTIFGKVTGDTRYNVPKLAAGDIGEHERPENPARIIRTEVLLSPFDDIVPRTTPGERAAAAAAARAKEEETAKRKRRKKAGTKNMTLLSFGDEQEELDNELAKSVSKKVTSMHDAPGNDPTLLSQALTIDDDDDGGGGGGKRVIDPEHVERVRQTLQLQKTEETSSSLNKEQQKDKKHHHHHHHHHDGKKKKKKKKHKKAKFDDIDDDEEEEVKANHGDGNGGGGDRIDETTQARRAEIARLQAELLGIDNTTTNNNKSDNNNSRSKAYHTDVHQVNDTLLNPVEARRAKFLKRKKSLKQRSQDTLAKLAQFSSTLRAKRTQTTSSTATAIPSVPVVIHQTAPLSDDDEDEKGDEWMTHQVKFVHRPQDNDRVHDDDYAVFDPLDSSSNNETGTKRRRR